MDGGRLSRLRDAAKSAGRRAGDALYRELVDEMSEGLCISDPEMTFQVVNPALEIIFGVEPGTLVGRNLGDFLDPADMALVHTQRQNRSSGAIGRYRLRIVRPDQAQRTLDVRAKPQRDAAGNYCGSVSLVTDITEQALADEALAASRRKLEMLVEQSPSAIIVLDGSFRITEWNRAAEATFGYSAAEALGQHAGFIIPPPDLPATLAALEQILLTGERNKNVNNNVRKDGSIILCEWSNAALCAAGDSDRGIISSCQDVTAQQAAAYSAEQARVREAELRTIERTTATYAHEVNNPLTGIIANMQMLLDHEAEGSERWLMLRETLGAAQKIGNVIRAMQSINKPSYRDYRGRDLIDLAESEE